MMMVRVILPAEMTLPVRMRPRIETSPVNGHFLSAKSEQENERSDGWLGGKSTKRPVCCCFWRTRRARTAPKGLGSARSAKDDERDAWPPVVPQAQTCHPSPTPLPPPLPFEACPHPLPSPTAVAAAAQSIRAWWPDVPM